MSDLVEEIHLSAVSDESSSQTSTSPRSDPGVPATPRTVAPLKRHNKPSPLNVHTPLSKSLSAGQYNNGGELSPRRLASIPSGEVVPTRLASIPSGEVAHRSDELSPRRLDAIDQVHVKPKHLLSHRKSWPNNIEGTIHKIGPVKSHVRSRHSSSQSQEADSGNTSPTTVMTTTPTVREDPPSPAEQRTIITSIESECTCTYAVSKVWYKRWEEYVGMPSTGSGGTNGFTPRTSSTHPHPTTDGSSVSSDPTPVEMDIHNDSHNEYVHEDVWKKFIAWFGLAPTHQLDRKHLYFKDEKPFDICLLSPFSGLLEHSVKKFNRFEEIGYIECQLRRVLQVAPCRRSRLWISEKAHTPRFRQLPLRFRMLNDCIHRDKLYILAIEQENQIGIWPTGEPSDPKGDLSKYRDVTGSQSELSTHSSGIVTPPTDTHSVNDSVNNSGEHQAQTETGHTKDVTEIQSAIGDEWQNKIEEKLAELLELIGDNVSNVTRKFLEESCKIAHKREQEVESKRQQLEDQLEHVNAKAEFLDTKNRDLLKQEKALKVDEDALQQDREILESDREQFHNEKDQVRQMHAITASRIKLDVGGSTYTTSIHTILGTPDNRDTQSLLSSMFSGKHELRPEADGSYFIDRDGTHFRHILNYLRDNDLDLDTSSQNAICTLRELLREAKYYRIQGLVTWIEKKLLATNS